MDARVLVVFGTRPEAIKMAPVIAALGRRDHLLPMVCVTAQHRDLLDQVLRTFQIKVDFDLDIMLPQQSLQQVTTRALEGVCHVIAQCRPAFVLVQGDTTTAFAAALAAFYAGIPVGHVEAGLRTGDLANPFPEEMNRRLISQIARFHYAPTETAAKNLLHEGVPPANILITGNTVVDACEMMRKRLGNKAAEGAGREVLVTMHRRESWGEPMRRVCQAIRRLAELRPELQFTFPVHPNPRVRSIVAEELGLTPSVRMIDPLPYESFLAALDAAAVVMTDSGGVQEEVASFGKPVVILRSETERPEVVSAGYGLLAGTSPEAIIEQTLKALDCWRAPRNGNPFGDGTAGQKIATHIDQQVARQKTVAAMA